MGESADWVYEVTLRGELMKPPQFESLPSLDFHGLLGESRLKDEWTAFFK